MQIARKESRSDVVIEHLWSAHTDELAALMQIGRRKIEEGQGVLDLGLDAGRDPAQAIVQAQSSRLLVDTVGAAWRRSGLTRSRTRRSSSSSSRGWSSRPRPCVVAGSGAIATRSRPPASTTPSPVAMCRCVFTA